MKLLFIITVRVGCCTYSLLPFTRVYFAA